MLPTFTAKRSKMAFSNFTSPESDFQRLSVKASAASFGEHSSLARSLPDISCSFGGNIYFQSMSVSMLLSDYVKRIPTTWTPPGYPNDRGHVLTKDVQQLMRRVLALMPDPENNIRCLSELKAENVMVELGTGRPFLRAVSWTWYNSNLAKMNYARVERIFRETIFNGAVASLPPDFRQLLDLMKSMGHKFSYTIQHHCSLVWSIDKKVLFDRTYDYSHNILRKMNPKLYEEVTKNLVFPQGWHILIQKHPYLAKFYQSRNKYKPLGRNAGKEVLRYKRNTYNHFLQHAVDATRRLQIYGQVQPGEMMETILPLVLHSFQLELDKHGLLRFTMIESLFQ